MNRFVELNQRKCMIFFHVKTVTEFIYNVLLNFASFILSLNVILHNFH